MHIYFSGIGGTAIGPLAMIARQAGYEVSGSDKQDSQYIQYLRTHGLENIHIGQTREDINKVHTERPIDWFVYSSAVSLEQPDSPEINFCRENNIKTSKRDELLNQIISDKKLKLIAIAGTHGKTTTTAMLIWLFKQLEVPISYSVGSKITFGEMGEFNEGSKYFIYEADEFDRNFLAFKPYLSLITGVSWDHHEIFPTEGDYIGAFQQFISNSHSNIIWREDASKLGLEEASNTLILNKNDQSLADIKLLGIVNRLDAWQAVSAVNQVTNLPLADLITRVNTFPGLSRRFERIIENLYTDYAHTPEKIKGCLDTAFEISKNVVIVYEPLTDRRQHYIKDAYKTLFHGVKKLYWVPSYLARENPEQALLSPKELIATLDNKEVAEPAELDDELKANIQSHLSAGDLVVCISGGGGGSLDEWLRQGFRK